MEVAEYGYEKSELLKITEQIYEYKDKKKKLEAELNSEEFHYQYISKRKHIVMHEVILRLFFIIPLTFGIFICTGFICMYGMLLTQERMENNIMEEADVVIESAVSGDSVMGVAFFLSLIVVVIGGYADIKLMIREFKMIVLLYVDINNARAVRFAEKYKINTFQRDTYISQEKIKLLKSQITSVQNKILRLLQQRKIFLEEKETVSDKEDCLESQQKEGGGKSKFNLRKSNMGTVDAALLHEFYLKEEQDIKQRLLQMEGQLQRINKKIVQINEDFEEVKRQMKLSLIIYLLLIIIQSAFSGVAATVTNFICLIVGLIYIFYVESKWKQPVLMYLIEKESNLTSEYAFCNNMLPVKVKRNELLEEIENCKKELIDIKENKELIIFS